MSRAINPSLLEVEEKKMMKFSYFLFFLRKKIITIQNNNYINLVDRNIIKKHMLTKSGGCIVGLEASYITLVICDYDDFSNTVSHKHY